jgi:hypothetical protein
MLQHSHLKLKKMKNSFKMGALALVIAVSFAACKGKGSAGSGDSTKDTTKVDTAKVADTTKKVADTTKAKVDTAKKDTTKKK